MGPQDACAVDDNDVGLGPAQEIGALLAIGGNDWGDKGGQWRGPLKPIEPADLVDARSARMVYQRPDQHHKGHLPQSRKQPQFANPVSEKTPPRQMGFDECREGPELLHKPVVDDPCRGIVAAKKDKVWLVMVQNLPEDQEVRCNLT